MKANNGKNKLKAKVLQKRPKDNKVFSYYYRKLEDYPTRLFWGRELIEENTPYDHTEICFLDKTVAGKIEENKRYKCWFNYSTPHDPADTSDRYYIAYIEEVPQKYVEMEEQIEELKQELKNYINKK